MHSNSALLALLGSLLVLPLATAQGQLDPDVKVEAPNPAKLDLGPNATARVTFEIKNTGPTDATLTSVTVTVPEGWTQTSDRPTSSHPLAANTGSLTVTVTVTTGAHSAAIQDGSLTLTADWSGPRPDSGDPVSNSATLTYLAPPPPPVVVPPEPTPWAMITSGILGGLFLVGGAAYVGQARRVHLALQETQLPITVGCDGVYRVIVRNPTGRRQTVELRIKELPIDWFAAFSFPKVILGPKESTTVPLLVRIPWSASAGALGHVTFQARPNTYSPWLRSASVSATVIDVARPGEVKPGYAA